MCAWKSQSSLFQFTPLREGRRGGRRRRSCPRPISIHAPPRGATVLRATTSESEQKFQFTPLREGRPFQSPQLCVSFPFQFTPLREGRHFLTFPDLHGRGLFQFTPLREGRRAWRVLGLLESHFNSRPSARGDKRRGRRRKQSPISIHAPPRGATRRS